MSHGFPQLTVKGAAVRCGVLIAPRAGWNDYRVPYRGKLRVAKSIEMLLLLVAASCAHSAPRQPASQPQVATQPATPEPAAPPVAAPKPAAPRVAAAPPPAAASPVAAPPAPVASPTLDLNALKEQLKETKAIGVFTKISLKNQVDDLMKQFREYYQGKTKLSLKQLRQSYDLLLMKVLSLLQDTDKKLASAIVSSREAIWGLLSDQKKFDALEI
jgi:hypothetical protein